MPSLYHLLNVVGVDEGLYWIVLDEDGIQHAAHFSGTPSMDPTLTVWTACTYSKGRWGRSAKLGRGIPNCLACAASPRGVQQ